MLKCQVHIEEERHGDYCLPDFPDRHNFHRLLRILRKHDDGLLIYDFDYRPSDLEDATKALVTNNLATTTPINEEDYKIQLNTEGIEVADNLLKRRDKIAEAAYHTLSETSYKQVNRGLCKPRRKLQRPWKYLPLKYNILFKKGRG